MDRITKEKVRTFMPTRNPNSYKGSYGSVLLVGGNENMGGAIILAASAVYSGAGLVTVATHPSNKSALHARLPEAMFVDMTDTNALKQHVEPYGYHRTWPRTWSRRDIKKCITNCLS